MRFRPKNGHLGSIAQGGQLRLASLRGMLLLFLLMHEAGNGAWLLVRSLVKHPGRARPNRLSNSTLEFH